jgi:outer membrane protein OmpA-like peptidoglycan-associated protein
MDTAMFHLPVIFVIYAPVGIDSLVFRKRMPNFGFVKRFVELRSHIGGVMRDVVPSSRFWVSFAAFLIAVGLFIPAPAALAQDNSAASSQAQFPPLSPQAQDLIQNIKAIYFPFDIYSRVVNADVLQADGTWLTQNTGSTLWIQGYADIRGDIYYNLVLSYRRAQHVKAALIKSGVDESRIQFATGWGKLYPICNSTDDSCYQQQRRVDIVPPDKM